MEPIRLNLIIELTPEEFEQGYKELNELYTYINAEMHQDLIPVHFPFFTKWQKFVNHHTHALTAPEAHKKE